MNNDLEILLRRTTLKKSFDEVIYILKQEYQSLGGIESFEPIMEGYEDANVVLNTSNGRFVLKIFNSDRTKENIFDYVKLINKLHQIDFPTMELIEGENKQLCCIPNNESMDTYFIVSHYFEGKNFDQIVPTEQDMISIARYLSMLNTFNFPVHEEYDSWGNKNLSKEYKLNKSKLSLEVQTIIAPIVEEFDSLDHDSFRKAVTHGDMQRKHVIKNDDGKYCIIDFGCMSYDAKVYDLSTYIAWFCWQVNTWENHEKIFHSVLQEYTKGQDLSHSEFKSLLPLIRASYAAYFLKTAVLLKEGDTSKETREWHESAKKMLTLTTT